MSRPPATATKLGTQLFDIIEKFADYAFNKSHSYGYGFIAYQTAYLKANYPAEYLACLLTSVKATLEKAAIYLAECRVMGIEVTVPDVNRSETDFTPVARRATPAQISFGTVGGAQRRRGPRRPHRRRAARTTARSPTSTTSASGSTPRCSTSGPWSR